MDLSLLPPTLEACLAFEPPDPGDLADPGSDAKDEIWSWILHKITDLSFPAAKISPFRYIKEVGRWFVQIVVHLYGSRAWRGLKKNLNQRNNNLCSPIDIRLQLITLLSYYLIGINNQSKTEVYNTELETFQPPESTKGSEGHISRANSALSWCPVNSCKMGSI